MSILTMVIELAADGQFWLIGVGQS